MSHDSFAQAKWTCEYCTYENFPNALKCTMCRGAKPLLGENIYRLREESPPSSDASATSVQLDLSKDTGKWSCEFCTYLNSNKLKECQLCRSIRTPNVTATNLHEHFKPLRICESDPSVTSPLKQLKWPCVVCTYENWPKARKCIMCGTLAPQRISPTHSSNAIKNFSPEREFGQSRGNAIDENITYNSIKRSGSRWENISVSDNHCIQQSPPPSTPSTLLSNHEHPLVDRHGGRGVGVGGVGGVVDWGWLNACLGVVQGDPSPVEAFLASGGDPTRQLTSSEVSLLNRPSAFDVGHTLVHLAIRFHREEMLATLVSGIDGGGSGLKRVPSYVAPELATSIRRHTATIFNFSKHSRSLPIPYVTEFTTFTLPAEIDDLPPSVQEQLLDELLDRDVQSELEESEAGGGGGSGSCVGGGVINWSHEISHTLGSRLHALWNRSQGDCLLDSLMQATWGVFDRDNLLRRALSDSLNLAGHLFYSRWCEYEAYEARALDFSLSESQWAEDWGALVRRATQPGASLQQLHVFALAHVLRRPIIVYGVKYVKSFRGETLGYAGFQGVYLPLLWEGSFCSRSPLALAYTRGHFSALVPFDNRRAPRRKAKGGGGGGNNRENCRNEDDCRLSQLTPSVISLPLVESDGKLLPIPFITKAEMGHEERLLRQWMEVNVTEGGILVAQQKCSSRPLLVAQMLEEWLNHYRRLAQMSSMPYNRSIPMQDFSSDGETDDE